MPGSHLLSHANWQLAVSFPESLYVFPRNPLPINNKTMSFQIVSNVLYQKWWIIQHVNVTHRYNKIWLLLVYLQYRLQQVSVIGTLVTPSQ